MIKPDKFTRCFSDFVRYFDVVEPYDRQDGNLNARVGFVNNDAGELSFWLQSYVILSTDCDDTRYQRFFERVHKLVVDLNRCRSFVDVKVSHTYDVYDLEDGPRFEVVSNG